MEHATMIRRAEPFRQWSTDLRDRLCAAFEAIERDYAQQQGLMNSPLMQFERRAWRRHPSLDEGGGEISLMHGRVFEKVGVNISTVYGMFSDAFRGEIPGTEQDPRFWAHGVSLVAHMRSPWVPAAHFNTRHIITSHGWFGGGGDLTPTFPNEEDTTLFHGALRDACDRHHPDYYPRYKEACDRYFYLPHRQEPRGVGGIFYDQFYTQDWNADLAFARDVGEAFLAVYPLLIRQHMYRSWTEEEKHQQLIKRGRYAEFNLLYDRGTRFGLMTHGNPEAILMSLPPVVYWP